MQATVTPAPDAEPPPGSGQNTGISGTRHAVARNPQDYGSPAPAAARTVRRLRPIKYAHQEPDDAAAPAAPGVTAPAATTPAATAPAAPPEERPADPALPDPALADPALADPALADPALADPALADPALAVSPRSPIPPRTTVRPDIMPADDAGSSPVLSGTVLPRVTAAGRSSAAVPASPAGTAPADDSAEAPVANEGLGIFGGVTTTEATDDPPPRSHDRMPWHRPLATAPQGGGSAGAGEPAGSTPPGRAPGGRPPAGSPPADEPEPGPVITIGASWNQAAAAPPAASQPEAESKPKSFGILRGMLSGGEADDDGRPRVTMRDLPPDVQLRFWRLRLTIMVIVGAVFAAITRSWEIALTLAILAGILDTVYRSRNAANYVVSGPHPGARKATRSQLAKMGREGFFSLQDRPIPNSHEIIDHLVIGPSGVYAIDSEKWDAKLPIRTLNGKRLYLGPESQKERLDHASWEATRASELLSEALGREILVRPALAIYGPKIPWDIASIRNVDVFTGQALRKYLKRRGKSKDGVVTLTREEVRTIYETAERVLPAAAQASATAPVG